MAFPRYVAAGLVNTGVTYVLYLILLQVLPYLWAYSITFLAGIALGYALNCFWVFRNEVSLKTAMGYPVIYGANYLLGVALLWILVDKLDVPSALAPLFVVAMSVPIMYFVTKILFKKKQ